MRLTENMDREAKLRELARRTSGLRYESKTATKILDQGDWSQYWPEIDRDSRYTGLIVGSEEGYLNVDDMAVIKTAEARAGEWEISDGYAHPQTPKGSQVPRKGF